MTAGYLPQGYKTSTRTTVDGVTAKGTVSPHGTVEHIEHWSGRVDAVARPKAIRMKLCLTDGAPLTPWHTQAIGEHQQAIDELKLARAVGQPEWVTACERRVAEWKARILETQ